MRNILSNLATKKVAGTVLVGASLVVGFAVVNNFSGGSQKPADEVYQSRLTDDAYNNIRGGGSISRAEIEKQMSVQDRYDARFLKGTSESADTDAEGPYESGFNAGEGFVYSSDGSPVAGGAYGQGGAYDANGQYIAGVRGAYANGDTYQPFNSTYEQGEGGVEIGGGRGASADAAAYGERQFKAVQGAGPGQFQKVKMLPKTVKKGKTKHLKVKMLKIKPGHPLK